MLLRRESLGLPLRPGFRQQWCRCSSLETETAGSSVPAPVTRGAASGSHPAHTPRGARARAPQAKKGRPLAAEGRTAREGKTVAGTTYSLNSRLSPLCLVTGRAAIS